MSVEAPKPTISTPSDMEQRKRNDAIVIDIPAELEISLWSKFCIQRVPKKLRKVNEAAYTPHMLSIGPFHHGKPELLGMEQHKRRYYDEFCKRTGKKQADLKRFIHGHLDEILSSYAGTVDFRTEAFLEIVLVDACFILELFLRNSEGRSDDYIVKTPWLRRYVELDLILFENQLPYAFLRQLYDFVASPPCLQQPEPQSVEPSEAEKLPLLSELRNTSSHPLSDHTRCFFSCARHTEDSEMDRIKHFTDLMRQALSPKKAFPSGNTISFLHSARRLEAAGVGLVPRQNPRVAEIELVQGMMDDVFCIGCIPCLPSMRLELPELVVQDETECLLRNVMALEQCLCPYEAHICSYLLLLDQMVDTADDVDLLVQRKVVKNLLGSNDVVAKLINRLCDQIVETNSCYFDVSERLNAYCDNCCNNTKATVNRTYFKDCWTASTAIFGFCVTAFSLTSIVNNLFFS